MSKKVALVLSSGGARGMAHIGVIEQLLERGYTISSIAGSSIGAVVGGIFAQGGLPRFKKWVCGLDRLDVFRLMDFTLSSQGFVKGDRVFQEMREFAWDQKIEELPIPFVAVATDMAQNKEVIFRKGSLFDALRASIALPSVVQPYRINGWDLVDGGVINPLPIEHVKRNEEDLLVVVNLNARIPKTIVHPNQDETVSEGLLQQWKRKWGREVSVTKEAKARLGYFEMISKSFEIAQIRLCSMTIEKFQPDLVVSVSRKEASTFDFYRSDELIEVGRKAFEKAYHEKYEYF
jgi:NTE family protein